ncbi:uncharacterized protein BX663DRAFT_514161 [Cokeromyces recurvatus]|uniref:uncharacterized protein n=1 Tax=Cokeromyces recurvatus TaxID=90255 RepID=UPI002220F065|nr:uncharacterized protein BX663DRAFT_514161 [Cokeromyces recurvatus]KAI7901340.1 hypothetical protein BX663DRAFT_514161 [Cokeromyces recurvatus]
MSIQFKSNKKNRLGSNGIRQADDRRPSSLLDSMDQKELEAQYEKIKNMLNNNSLKLPDGGAKLKAKLEQIKCLLDDQNAIANKVSELSLDDKINVRQETIDRSNNISPQVHSTKLLKAHSLDSKTEQNTSRSARMMSLDESMHLQEAQQKDIKLANMKKRMESVRNATVDNLADDLAMTMNSLQLDPETRQPRPDDDGLSDEEGEDADSDDLSDSENEELYERYDDEGFEEDEQHIFDDGRQQDDNTRI